MKMKVFLFLFLYSLKMKLNRNVLIVTTILTKCVYLCATIIEIQIKTVQKTYFTPICDFKQILDKNQQQ